jgi:hypothetical protein
MSRAVRRRYWFEIGLAVVTGALLILTLITKEWIEGLFGVDPDGGSGALEWAIVAGLAIATIVSVVLARHEWVRAAPVPT